jgi:hypothetical protein
VSVPLTIDQRDPALSQDLSRLGRGLASDDEHDWT